MVCAIARPVVIVCGSSWHQASKATPIDQWATKWLRRDTHSTLSISHLTIRWRGNFLASLKDSSCTLHKIIGSLLLGVEWISKT